MGQGLMKILTKLNRADVVQLYVLCATVQTGEKWLNHFYTIQSMSCRIWMAIELLFTS